MPSTFMPYFAEGCTYISDNLAYKKEKDRIYYFNGHELPLYSHHQDDHVSWRMILSQFCVHGLAKQSEVIRAFGIPSITMKRSVKLFREKGAAGFFVRNQPKRKPRVLIPEVIENIQERLDEGFSPREIANELGLKQNTIEQAIRAGRLKKSPASIAHSL